MLVASEQAALAFDAQSASLRDQAGVFAAVETEMGAQVLATNKVTEAHSRMNIGAMEMMHVVRASGDSFAAGLPPMTIFTEQMGRITDAMSLYAMTSGEPEGVMGRFAAFMGGPWGIAVMAGVSLLGILGKSLFDAGDEAEKTKGKFFDLAGGMDALANNATIAANAMDRLRDSLAQPGDVTKAANAAVVSKISAMGELARIKREIADVENMQRFTTDPNAMTAQAVQLSRLYNQKDTAEKTIAKANEQLVEVGDAQRAAAMQEANKQRLDARPKKERAGRKERPPKRPIDDWEAEFDVVSKQYMVDLSTRQGELSAQDQLLQVQMQLATTNEERLTIARQLLRNEQVLAGITIDRAQAGGSINPTEAELRRQDSTQLFGSKLDLLQRQHQNPLQAFASTLDNRDTTTEVQSLVVDELTSVRNAIHSAVESITGTKDPLINGLIQMLIENVLLKPIANMLSSSLSGLGGGLFGFLHIPGFAGGTMSAPGGLAIVGENGPELVNLPRGSQVIPNHALAYPAIPSAEALRGQAPVVHQYFTFNATNSVLASDLVQTMQRIGATVLAAAPGVTQAEMADHAMQRLPG